MGQRLNVSSELKPIGGGAAKASLNRARAGASPGKFDVLDPKPSDLAMSRLKVG